MPWCTAAARTNGLNAEPAGRWPWVARLNLAWLPPPKKSRPPTRARTLPVPGSSETTAASGSVAGLDSTLATACSASACLARSTVVEMRRPPLNRFCWRSAGEPPAPYFGSSRICCFTASTK